MNKTFCFCASHLDWGCSVRTSWCMSMDFEGRVKIRIRIRYSKVTSNVCSSCGQQQPRLWVTLLSSFDYRWTREGSASTPCSYRLRLQRVRRSHCSNSGLWSSSGIISRSMTSIVALVVWDYVLQSRSQRKIIFSNEEFSVFRMPN